MAWQDAGSQAVAACLEAVSSAARPGYSSPDMLGLSRQTQVLITSKPCQECTGGLRAGLNSCNDVTPKAGSPVTWT